MSNSNPGRSGPNGWFRSRGKTHLWITIEALWGKVEALSRLKNGQRPNFPTLFPWRAFLALASRGGVVPCRAHTRIGVLDRARNSPHPTEYAAGECAFAANAV